MPLYEYQCVDCDCKEPRVAGVDDWTALCAHCGSLMLRLDVDIFEPYFKKPDCPWCGQTVPGTSRICQRHAEMLKEEEV